MVKSNPERLALIVMAAGIGSRYGGLKQVEPVGPHGEMVIHYAIYDAIRAGFTQVVFVIREDMQAVFRQKVGKVVERQVDTAYVFQDLFDLPAGFQCPAGRVKPWGTGHAVLSCRHAIHSPFAVINADDFYGLQAYQLLVRYLRHAQDQPGSYEYCMIGYVLANTLSEHGSVARGVCQLTADGYLSSIHERTNIQRADDEIRFTEDGVNWFTVSPGSIVSMNVWGFTPSLFDELEDRFQTFLYRNQDRLLKAEYYLPAAVNDMVQEGKARVKVLLTEEKWFGVTYPQDRPALQQAIRNLIRQKRYPENLWQES